MQKVILQLKATLIATDPPVWRRLLVPAQYSFADLHSTLQDAFGWTDSHLHRFLTENPYKRNASYKRISLPMPDIDLPDEEPSLDELREKISAWLVKPEDTVYYEYDFGDSWMHEIKLEKTLRARPKEQYPQLVVGANACPPEDCGGPSGYAHLLEVVADPNDEEHEEMIQWLGIDNSEEFDPTFFNPKHVLFGAHKRAKRR